MSKMRSHTTVNGTAIARSHVARAYHDERDQRRAVDAMLERIEKKAFHDTKVVVERLDSAYERDKARTEKRIAEMPKPLDLGD